MAGKRLSGKRHSVSAGKTPEKSENELKNSKNLHRRRSKMLAVFIQNNYNVVIYFTIYIRLFYCGGLNMNIVLCLEKNLYNQSKMHMMD